MCPYSVQVQMLGPQTLHDGGELEAQMLMQSFYCLSKVPSHTLYKKCTSTDCPPCKLCWFD